MNIRLLSLANMLAIPFLLASCVVLGPAKTSVEQFNHPFAPDTSARTLPVTDVIDETDAKLVDDAKIFIQTTTAWITCSATSPDGRYALTGEGTGFVKLWDILAEAEIRTYRPHTDRITRILITPDGRYAISASNDKTAKMWSIKTGKVLAEYSGHTDWVEIVAISPDGRYVLTGCNDGYARLFDAKSGKELRRLQVGVRIYGVKLSPDGRVAMVGGTQAAATSFMGNSYATVHFWDTGTGAIINTFHGTRGQPSAMAFSPDGRFALCADGFMQPEMNNIHLLDGRTGAFIKTIAGKSWYINTLDFSPNGKYLLAGGYDSIVSVWEFASEKPVNQFGLNGDVPSSAYFTADGEYIFVSKLNSGVSFRYSIKTAKADKLLRSKANRMTALAMIGAQHALTADQTGHARIWDITTGQQTSAFAKYNMVPYAISVSDSGKKAAVAYHDGHLKYLDTSTGSELWSIPKDRGGEGSGNQRVVVSPDGSMVAMATKDGDIRILDGLTGNVINTVGRHASKYLKYPVRALAFSRDGNRLLSSGIDDRVIMWDAKTWSMIRSFEFHGAPNALIFMPDSKSFAGVTSHGHISIRDIQSGVELNKIERIGSSPTERSLTCMALHPNGKWLAAAGTGAGIRVWDIETKQLLMTLEGHQGAWSCPC